MPGVRLGVEERETIGLGVARREGFAEITRRSTLTSLRSSYSRRGDKRHHSSPQRGSGGRPVLARTAPSGRAW